MKDITEVYFYGGYKTTGGQTHEEQFELSNHFDDKNLVLFKHATKSVVTLLLSRKLGK